MTKIHYESEGIWDYAGNNLRSVDGLTSGAVATRHGYVMVYADESGFSRLSLIYDERHYTRVYDAYYRPQFLVTLARRFAGEIVGDLVAVWNGER